MQRGQAQVAGFGKRHGVLHGLAVADFAHQDHVRRLAQRVLEGRLPAVIFKGEVAEIKEIMKKSRNLGMQTFDQALFDLFESNLITYEDALRNADSVNDLRARWPAMG